MAVFKVFPEKFIRGQLTSDLPAYSDNVKTSIDDRLLKVLSTNGDYTFLQIGSGDSQEVITAKREDDNLVFVRTTDTTNRFDFSNTTAVYFTNSAVVTNEMIKLAIAEL